MRHSAAVAALVLLTGAALAAPVAAQTITGVAVAEENGQPLRAALVVLLDSAGQRRLGALTDSAGHFALRAPAPGRYRVLATSLGRQTVRSDEVALGAGATVSVRLESAISPLLLKPIVVDTRSRCKVRPEVGELASDLWEEARKAMDLSAAAGAAYRGVLRTYRRELDPHTFATVRETASEHPWSNARAFASASEEELNRRGYVYREGTDWVFAGPDEQVLRSDGFMDHHCLRPVKGDSRHTGLVGVAFKPVREDRPDIEGVAWLDSASAVLRSVEFHYTALPWSVAEESQGGRVVYGRSSWGAMTVMRWSLRMPEVQVKRAYRVPGRNPFGADVATVLRVIEAGGEALENSTARPGPGAR